MNFRTCCLTAALMLAPATVAFGQFNEPTHSAPTRAVPAGLQETMQPVGAPVWAHAGQIPAMESQAMPVDKIDRPTSLDDALEKIQGGVPAFNSIIVRDPGVAAEYPTLPVMTLKNVTVGQFLQFVQASFPGVQFRRIDGPTGSLYSVRIRLDDETIRRNQLAQERNRVRMYRLTDVIRSLADEKDSDHQVQGTALIGPDGPAAAAPKAKPRDERIKQATAEVLSLLQAALEQTDGDAAMTLKIHEPTLTLLFKGSPTKQAVLEDALSTLQPNTNWSTNANWYRPQARYLSPGRNNAIMIPSGEIQIDAPANPFQTPSSAGTPGGYADVAEKTMLIRDRDAMAAELKAAKKSLATQPTKE